MSEMVQIYVNLKEEGVEVWRPVQAEHIEGNIYRIISQPYNNEIETWEFAPNDKVVCEYIIASEGRILVATKKAEVSQAVLET